MRFMKVCGAIFFIILFSQHLGACSSSIVVDDEVNPTPAPTHSTPVAMENNQNPTTLPSFVVDNGEVLTPQPMPPHIHSVIPKSGSLIPYSIFTLELPEDRLWYGVQNFETGFHSAICVTFNLRSLAMAGDEFLDETLSRRARLELNGRDYRGPDHIFGQATLLTFELPEGGTVMSMPDSPFCWQVVTQPGVQLAIVEFERSDGSLAYFDWQFILTVDD